MSDTLELYSVAEALKATTKQLQTQYKLPFLHQVEVALSFGHAEGLSGWPEIRKVLQQTGLTANGAHVPAVRVFEMAITAYANHLIDSQSIEISTQLNKLANALIAETGDVKLPLVDHAAADPIDELSRHRASLTGGDPVSEWHRRWVQQVSELVEIAASREAFNVTQDLVLLAFDEYRFPVDPSGMYEPYADAGRAIQILVRRVITNAGYELIEPVIGERMIGTLHITEPGSPIGGEFIRHVVSRGLRKGSVLERAVVRLSARDSMSHPATPPLPIHMT